MINGEYYCINGCLKYPISNEKILTLVKSIIQSGIIHKIKYYKVNCSNFNYDDMMEGLIEEGEHQMFSIPDNFPYTFISLDFVSFDMPCRLLLEYFDNDYYGVTLLFSGEISITDVIREKIILPFYKILKPIYGNNGIEKAIFSLNQIEDSDIDIFNSEFMLSYDIYEKIKKKHLENMVAAVPIENAGIHFTKQKKNVSELIFRELMKHKS